MTTPGSLLAPKATPFPLRETAVQKIFAAGVHSSGNTLQTPRISLSFRRLKTIDFLLIRTTPLGIVRS